MIGYLKLWTPSISKHISSSHVWLTHLSRKMRLRKEESALAERTVNAPAGRVLSALRSERAGQDAPAIAQSDKSMRTKRSPAFVRLKYARADIEAAQMTAYAMNRGCEMAATNSSGVSCPGEGFRSASKA